MHQPLIPCPAHKQLTFLRPFTLNHKTGGMKNGTNTGLLCLDNVVLEQRQIGGGGDMWPDKTNRAMFLVWLFLAPPHLALSVGSAEEVEIPPCQLCSDLLKAECVPYSRSNSFRQHFLQVTLLITQARAPWSVSRGAAEHMPSHRQHACVYQQGAETGSGH
jgi:hypothetical protein